jgi:Holliday junction resolvase RusA-like endonuclease
MNPIHILVYGDPKPKGSMKGFPYKDKNTGQIRVAITGDNPATRAWEDAIRFAAQEQAIHLDKPLEGPIQFNATFILQKPKTVKRELPTVKPDLSKLVRAAEDGLIAIIYKDDSQIVQYGLVEKIYGDQPCVDITIIPL